MQRPVILLLLAVLGLTPMPPEAPRPNRSLVEAAAGMTARPDRLYEEISLSASGPRPDPLHLRASETVLLPQARPVVSLGAVPTPTVGAVPRSSQGPPV